MTNDKRPDAALAYRVLDHIDANPGLHDPRVWIERRGECGTAACMAGWTCLLAGDRPYYRDGDGDPEAEYVVHAGAPELGDYIPVRAANLLGMKLDGGYTLTGYRLFEPHNTREDLGRLVAEIFGPRPGEHVNCPHDPGGASGDPSAAMICAPLPGSAS